MITMYNCIVACINDMKNDVYKKGFKIIYLNHNFYKDFVHFVSNLILSECKYE